MSSLEENQNRMLAALQALEAKIAEVRSGDQTAGENQALRAEVQSLQTQVATLKSAGEEAVKDLDLALGQLADLAGGAHG